MGATGESLLQGFCRGARAVVAIWVRLCDSVRGDIGAWREVGKRKGRG